MADGVGIQVHGLDDVNRAFRRIDKQLAKDLGGELKDAAAPVVATGREKVARFSGASIKTIRARRSGLRVYVEQGARKTTGKHPDFGALQMREVLIPALDEHADEIERHVEQAINAYARGAGF